MLSTGFTDLSDDLIPLFRWLKINKTCTKVTTMYNVMRMRTKTHMQNIMEIQKKERVQWVRSG